MSKLLTLYTLGFVPPTLRCSVRTLCHSRYYGGTPTRWFWGTLNLLVKVSLLSSIFHVTFPLTRFFTSRPMESLWKWCRGHKDTCFDNQLLSPSEKSQPRPPRPPLLPSSSLFDLLPSELIFEITSWLPTSSAVSFSLCNQTLFRILSRPYLNAVGANHTDSQERDLLLDLLRRDSIDLFFCYTCRKLHHLVYEHLSPPTAAARFAWTSNSRCKSWIELHRKPLDGLTFEHLQVAANLYQHGLAADALRYLQCATISQPQPQPRMLSLAHWGYYFFESCFINGRICIRSQSWLFVSEATGFSYPGLFYVPICSHLDPNLQNCDLLGVALNCKLMHLSVDEPPCSYCQNLIQCPDCATEVSVDSAPVKGRSKASVITISMWQYPGVGAGSAEGCRELPASAQTNGCDLKDRPAPGDIRDAFERMATTSFDSIWTVELARRHIKKNPRLGVKLV